VRKTLALVFILAFAEFFVYHRAFLNFFTQDDFILITQFSGHGLLADLWNAFGPPHVTHWRPLHNLYFLIGGELFGRDIFWYHFVLFSVQITAGLFIYKSLKALNLNGRSALIAAILYVSHPAQFISYYWISGGATAIGFCFFVISFYLHVSGRDKSSLLLFLASLLSSEAMILGVPIFIIYDYLFRDKNLNLKHTLRLAIISVLFLVLKLILTPKNTFNIYKLELSPSVFYAAKYYTLRTLGFAGVAQDQLLAFLLLAWVLIILFLFINHAKNKSDWVNSLFLFLVTVLGLFPFVLIPSHLSPHYMNISIFGFSGFVGLALSKTRRGITILMLIGFLAISFFSVKLIEKDNWVTTRANLALRYILEIERSDLPAGSTLIFNDNYISSSYDAYIALGTGDAINFWFKAKNYKTCFSAFENCSRMP
jgi:hypothetical protein